MTRLLLLSFLLLLSSCDITKKIFKKKESTLTTTSNETITTKRTETSDHWIRNGSSLFSRDGSVAIEFDGITSIDIGPDHQIRAVGNNPKIISHTSETSQDTLAEVFSNHTRHQEDSASLTAATEEKEVLDTSVDKSTKTQKLTPILIILFLIIAMVLTGRFFKLI